MKLAQLTAVTLAVLLSSAFAIADDRHVEIDRKLDFSTVKSFALRNGKVTSRQPDLNHSLVIKNVGDTIRTVLLSKGLKETNPDTADALVDFTVNGLDFSVGPGGRASAIGERGGGRRGRGSEDTEDRVTISSSPVSFTEGTLVIDLTMRDSLDLIWRGVYRDKEKSSAKLSKKLPGDAKKLLSEYPKAKN